MSTDDREPPAARPVTLEGDDLAELGLLLDGLLDGDRYGRDGVATLQVTADVEVGATLELRDPDGTHLASAEAQVIGGHGITTGPVTHHRAPRVDGFVDLFAPRDQVRSAIASHDHAEVLAWQPIVPPSVAATAEVIAAVRDRGATLLFQPVVLDRRDRARAAGLRAARLVRDHLAAEVPVVTRALPPVALDRGYGEVVARQLGATDLFAPDGDGGDVDPEVAAAVDAGTPRPGEAGVALLLTGLSGSGKSTIAQRLYARLLEDGQRTVTLLDGDLVRRSLSSELTFSKEHRDLNVRRIGYVASEVAKHGGVAIMAPIAPYDAPRRDVRRMVEEVDGRFVLVHVDTPLEVCEQRDVKGLYAAARAGRIPNFTGISDPYEVPEDADLTIDTSQVDLDDAVDRLLDLLRSEGHLG